MALIFKVPIGAIILIVCVAASVGAAESNAWVRLNQTGFCFNGTKRAFLMSARSEEGAEFKVTDSKGGVVYSARVEKQAGAWNQQYTHVYLLDFSAATSPGVYTIKVEGPVSASSPSFRIGSPAEIYGPLLRNAFLFFQAQRDGPDVSNAVLNRQPSHLADKSATMYEAPAFGKNGLQGRLKTIGGPVDVSGGWLDAGDYVKFVETTSYVTPVMLLTARDWPSQAGAGKRANFAVEGRFGLEWLLKMWDDKTKILYCQVGLGDGNQYAAGDHDRWRLPEMDDKVEARAGSAENFIKHRPVFPAGPAGSAISPNLAGRLAAGFALGSQVYRRTDSAFADRLLLAAEHIFDLAETNHSGELTTTYPHEFYPEEEWRDDIEWGAVELYFAVADAKTTAALPHSDAAFYLQSAARWAHEYLQTGAGDSLNLYDTSGLAHYELCRALEEAGMPKKLEVNRDDLLNQLKKRLDAAIKCSNKDCFGLGVRYASGDLVPHVLGLAIEAELYDRLTRKNDHAAFVQRQLDFVLGANAWGASFIVGAGTVFPRHIHHQIANLAGSLDGTAPVLLGAVVDGPVPARGKSGVGDLPDGARPTPWADGADPFAPFSGQGVRFVDDVSSWATVEPADDYTVPTVLIFAMLAGRE